RGIANGGSAAFAGSGIVFLTSLTNKAISCLRHCLSSAIAAFGPIVTIANVHFIVAHVKRTHATAKAHAISAFAFTHGRRSLDRNALDMCILVDLRRVKHRARGDYRRRDIGRTTEFEISVVLVESTINADARSNGDGFIIDFTGQTDRRYAKHL